MRIRIVPLLAALSTAALLASSCFLLKQPTQATAQKKLTVDDIAIGMPLKSFRTIYSEARLNTIDQWETPGEILGLRGQWTYSFYRGKLNWYVFNSYESDVNQETFLQYFDATNKVFDQYDALYGKADSTVGGVTEFKDPHNGYGGYPVVSASWTHENENIHVDYSVLGNGSERSQLLFTVEIRNARTDPAE